MEINLLVGGDTCPIGRNQRLFEQGSAHGLLNDLLPEFEQADLSIVNLECPLVQEAAPIKKCGPALSAPETCALGFKTMGIGVVGLANNHIMDYGPRGLTTTIDALEAAGIGHVGAGRNVAEARQIHVRNVKGVRIGILAVAEHEFCIATIDTPGANPLNVIDFVRNVNEHRSKVDKLIVLVHGGSLHYRYPSPMLLETCRFLVEQGAHAVLCQHSHCAGCMEVYRGAPIIYGQGNFLFDGPDRPLAWQEGILVSLRIGQTGEMDARLIPYRQSADQPGARRMNAQEANAFLEAFDARSAAIADSGRVEAEWKAFCRRRRRAYLHALYGRPGIVRRLAGKFGLLHYLNSPHGQRTQLHLVRCESHREALITVLTMETNRQNRTHCASAGFEGTARPSHPN